VAGLVAKPRGEGVLRRKVLGPAVAVAGLLAAWTAFYAIARVSVEINRRVGEQQWRPR
jgi:hypothetical protein